MKIEGIELTKEEMKEAIGQWLRGKGLTVFIRSVDSNGYPVRSFTVDCSTEPESSPQKAEKLSTLDSEDTTVSDAARKCMELANIKRKVELADNGEKQPQPTTPEAA